MHEYIPPTLACNKTYEKAGLVSVVLTFQKTWGHQNLQTVSNKSLWNVFSAWHCYSPSNQNFLWCNFAWMALYKKIDLIWFDSVFYSFEQAHVGKGGHDKTMFWAVKDQLLCSPLSEERGTHTHQKTKAAKSIKIPLKSAPLLRSLPRGRDA